MPSRDRYDQILREREKEAFWEDGEISTGDLGTYSEAVWRLAWEVYSRFDLRLMKLYPGIWERCV